MEKIDTDYKQRREKFRLNFTRCALSEVHEAPLKVTKMRELRSFDDVSLKRDDMHYLWVASREEAKHKTR